MHIGGYDVTALAPALRDVTFVFQQYSLYPHLNVFDNLAFPLRSPLRRTPEAEIQRKVVEVAKMLRIDDKLANPATKLSGGQMQRVAIGRALVREPALTLMDEPLSSLDAKLRNDLRLELKRIQQDLGATMLYVTHDQIEAMTLANRIGVLDQRRARAGGHAAADLPRPGEQHRRGAARLAAHQPAAARRVRRWPRRRQRPRSACGPTARGCAWPTATTAATRRRSCDASSTWATRRTCYVALGGTAGEESNWSRCAATPAGFEPGRAVSVEFSTVVVRCRRPTHHRLTLERRCYLRTLDHRGRTQTLVDHVEELTALDSAIGDGDHGLNMKRGAHRDPGQAARTRRQDLNDALKTMGMTCMSTVGGSSGPVFGTLLVTLGKELPAAPRRRRRGACAGRRRSRR